jgi:hypothetical protein
MIIIFNGIRVQIYSVDKKHVLKTTCSCFNNDRCAIE